MESLEPCHPPADQSKSIDLDQLESETLDILQRFGSPGPRSARRIGPPVSYPPKRGESARPWTGASSIINRRPCRTAGSINKTPNKLADARPCNSIREQVKIDENDELAIDDDCKMFKADGTARNALRDTISSALSTSHFDSVPSLLVSGQHKNESLRSRSSPFIGDSSPYMVSVMGINKSTPKKVARDGVTEGKFDPCKIRSLSLRDIKYSGFDKVPVVDATAGGENEKKASEKAVFAPDKEVCFNCWCAGEGNTCLIHTEKGPSSIGQSLSMCSNWNTGYLRRKYRSEQNEEHFSFSQQSLVFDRSQKQFSTLEQPKHPIYRLVTQHIARLNFTYQRRQNVQAWFRSFIKKLKDGNFQGKRSNASAAILLLKSTVKNMMSVHKLSIEVKDQHPQAPVTGTTTREMLGKEHVLVEKLVTVNGNEEKCSFVMVGPTPVPKALYRPRQYEPLPPTTFVLNDVTEAHDGRLDFSSIISSSIQYAKFGRKRANENIAVGGLSAEMIVSRQFTERFPPQYKNFLCKHDAVLVPPSVSEESPSFPTLEVRPGKLPYIRRELVTPLDSRLPPAVMVKTGLTPNDRHFFGVNRHEQTGEEEDVGFRTSTWYPLPIIDDNIDTTSFKPSQSVATPNTPVISAMRTMAVDGTYPFRKEQSRDNCVEDLYHLLLSDGSCSSNKLQMFTCVGSQQCGYFMQNGNSSLPIGRVVTKVVRSWAFLQSKSEETLIYDEEMTSLGLGGVLLKNRPRYAESLPSGVLTKNSRGQVREAILRKMPVEGDYLVEPTLAPPRVSSREAANKYPVIKTSIVESLEGKIQVDDLIHTSRSNQVINSQVPSCEENPQIAQPNSTAPPESKASAKNDNALAAESISHAIGETLKSFSSKPEDLIRLGMGIGASLGAQGFFNLGCAEKAIATPMHKIISEEKTPELEDFNCIDNITIKSCSSEESKLELDEGNLVSFSDFNNNPQGLLNVIASTRVGTKRVEYLTYTFSLNLPAAQNVEPLKPRSMADEWRETNYDPWSAGRDPTSSTFVRSLAHETKKWPKPENRVDGPKGRNTSREFAALCTLCRHGKYRELEEMLNNPSWSLPIDYCDDAGNTLLMIACQNGNRRISKTCLRRGSQINHQNLNGNTCLHFSFGYGFDDLGEYLISKGADDSLQNANGLTCYEGLDMDELDG